MPLNQQKLETDLLALFNATQGKTTRAARRQFCEEFAQIICDCIRRGDIEIIATRDLASITTSLGATLGGGPVILKMK